MRALFHLRPATGADRTLRLCAALRLRPVRRWWESGPGVTLGDSYALRVTLLLRIRSGSRATVYKPHQQNDVNSLKHDDEQ